MAAGSLTTRLTGATGPDRELDALIWIEAQGWTSGWVDDRLIARDRTHPHEEYWVGVREGGYFLTAGQHPPIPRYTASLDAALTLLPEGWQWQLSNRAPQPHRGRAYVNNGELQFTGGNMGRNPGYRGHEFTAHTAPIAACLACLAARRP